jgi:polyisoprenoid-binding protein YceI
MRASLIPGSIPRALVALAFLAVPSGAQQQAADWTIDSAHSRAQFGVRHMMVSTVRGQLGKITGTVKFDGNDVRTVLADVTIDVTGIDTQEPKRDDHLRSADFFDVAKFPTMTFKSRRVEPGAAGHFKLVGDLIMHGVTKEVALDVEGPSPEIRQGNVRRIGAVATTTINRRDFGLNWSRVIETGGVVVADMVSVTIDLELTRATTGPSQ